MKTALLAAFVLCCALNVCESTKCRQQEDCEADECCMRLLPITDPSCMKLRQKGDQCLTSVEMVNGKYLHACPCAEGLTCRAEKVTDYNGIVNYKDLCGV